MLPFLNVDINRTVLAVNVGGCIIPVFISFYLLKGMPIGSAILGITIMSIVSYFSSRPVKHIGIRVSFIFPLIMIIIVSMIIAEPHIRAKFAYICGTLGLLIGADILHLKDFDKLGKGVLSIGGAGVFDSVFFIGIISAFLL